MNAAPVWSEGNMAQGVGIAVLDTGVERLEPLGSKDDPDGTEDGVFEGLGRRGQQKRR